MADVHNPATRSKNMRAIRTSDTAIEKKLAIALDQLGIMYRTQVKELSGKPDFVIDDYKAIIFVHGCFWHHHDCHLFKLPSTRTEFWLKKISDNVNRDHDVVSILSQDTWRILVVWECSLRGKLKLSDESLSERLEEWLCSSSGNAEINIHGIKSMFTSAD
ncbi:DNA mismatch endonuclease Vsr [Limnobaculum zhutongyuii]|uniref:Very short patch repair endonuclease n=1 Tax=Limnobaculum zhutongyuii TaxID=2498113 RepID=A0A411WM93_9GAMM|nr:DNA mismatch endonuclease Vsr [Limnobaculum zhutongyuii]QBH97267.1 DNA mismatch endonuclease Vsr [Limnobaculum zhutongyuii]TQS88526.1 DNA mismatch endonuclease Vsr [Limnobaculum zhutongyuii]